MIKFLSRFLILLLIIIFSSAIYLSYFGIETDKFDTLIKTKANEVNQNIKLEFNKTKIHLSPTQFNLIVKFPIPIITNDNYTSSQIINIKTDEILNFISKKGIAVIPGFQ